MDYQCNVIKRANNKYISKKFNHFLREILSNSLHSCILSDSKDKKIILEVQEKENETIITISDNGQGFTRQNFQYFTSFDEENPEKIENKLKSLGQGRLSIIHFTDSAECISVYKENSEYYKREFSYPIEYSLFTNNKEQRIKQKLETDILTTLKFKIYSKSKLKKSKKFFETYNNSKLLAIWIFENFFPFFKQYQDINIEAIYNKEDPAQANMESICSIECKFEIEIEKNSYFEFIVYGIDTEKPEDKINCCAGGLVCKFSDGKTISYDLKEAKQKFYLVSDYFDEMFNGIEHKIEISDEVIEKIEEQLSKELDNQFKKIIEKNTKQTNKNIETFQSKFPSFSPFLEPEEILKQERNILSAENIQKLFIKKKNEEELNFWKGTIDQKYKEKIIDSSLFNYIKHREDILKIFQNDFLEKFNENLEQKKGNEDIIHNIFFNRSKEQYENEENDYFKHNLWLIDDKYSLFTTAQSTLSGKKDSDIYLYCDKHNATEIVIIELKSSHEAHNKKTMVAQIQNYANNIYNKKSGFVKGSVTNTDKCLYSGYIIASDEDISKQIEESKMGGSTPKKIPFLSHSYYIDVAHPEPNGMRIELITYSDLFSLGK